MKNKKKKQPKVREGADTGWVVFDIILDILFYIFTFSWLSNIGDD